VGCSFGEQSSAGRKATSGEKKELGEDERMKQQQQQQQQYQVAALSSLSSRFDNFVSGGCWKFEFSFLVHGDVTSPSSSFLRSQTTTTTTRRTRRAAPPVSPVQALASSIEARPLQLYVEEKVGNVEIRSSRDPLSPRTPPSTAEGAMADDARKSCERRSSVGGSSRPRSRRLRQR
jgi:hypothetical protein